MSVSGLPATVSRTLSLHDALPICGARSGDKGGNANVGVWAKNAAGYAWLAHTLTVETFKRLVSDRKSTRLNSSHVATSYAVFCWKKKSAARTITASSPVHTLQSAP